ELSLTDSAVRAMMAYSWPGNVRELENTLERASVLSESGIIGPELVSFSQLDTSTQIVASLGKASMPASAHNGAPMVRERVM
ncbi:hypothetical protein L6232_26135, partial [Shewanella sp. C31]|nr:hypothetical protein [Shewanella electrica]